MRRFIADASHELRTPLTSIKGFRRTVHRQGAGALLGAMGRIDTEAQRMKLLVEDLLMLARARCAPAAAIPAGRPALAGVRRRAFGAGRR